MSISAVIFNGVIDSAVNLENQIDFLDRGRQLLKLIKYTWFSAGPNCITKHNQFLSFWFFF